MPLYACDNDDLIFAADALKGKTYWCLECFRAVKVRRGKDRFPHFYHLQSSPLCRLYSKSEDHLRAQLQLQKLFPQGAIEMERPFIEINRVADLCWEKEKIVFEIQCSPITASEAEARIKDYKLIGYESVWLLDDRRYNRKALRPAEEFLRQQSCYYIDIQRGLVSHYYDQFEIFEGGKRVKRGRKLTVDLQKPIPLPSRFKNLQREVQLQDLPRQLQIQIGNRDRYFFGDRIHRGLHAEISPSALLAIENWRSLELQFATENKRHSGWKQWVIRHLSRPYLTLLEILLRGK